MGKIESAPGWEWLQVEVDGDDLVIRNTHATWWGGAHDPMDDGPTASGVNTKTNPHFMGCSLPMNGRSKETRNSPIPKLPWHTRVHVYCLDTHKQLDVELIDVGPAGWTRHGLDLTVTAFEALGLSLSKGVTRADIRIIGGAKYLK